eukprot:c38112_g1_i1 orf=258-410(+)
MSFSDDERSKVKYNAWLTCCVGWLISQFCVALLVSVKQHRGAVGHGSCIE